MTVSRFVPALLAAVLLAGCGSEPVLPDDDTALRNAEQVLLRKCMQRAGFEYSVVDAQPVPDAREFPYVVDDVAWARRHGYGSDLRKLQEKAREEDPNQRYFRSLPPQRRAEALKAANGDRSRQVSVTTPDGATMGRDPGSCRSQAQQALYGDLRAWFEAQSTVDWLTSARQQRVSADPAWAVAVRPWADCMAAAGHQHADPAHARASATADSPLPRDDEIRLAVAEAECANSSGLAEAARTLDRKHDDELRAGHRAVVDTHQRLRSEALPRARSVLLGEDH